MVLPHQQYDGRYLRNILNSALNIRYTSGDITFNSTTSYQFLADRMNMDQDYTAADLMHLSQKQLQNGNNRITINTPSVGRA